MTDSHDTSLSPVSTPPPKKQPSRSFFSQGPRKPLNPRQRRIRKVLSILLLGFASVFGIFILVNPFRLWHGILRGMAVIDGVIALAGLILWPHKGWREEVREVWGEEKPKTEEDPLGLTTQRGPGWNTLRIGISAILVGLLGALFLASVPWFFRLNNNFKYMPLYLAPFLIMSVMWMIFEFRQRMGDPPGKRRIFDMKAHLTKVRTRIKRLYLSFGIIGIATAIVALKLIPFENRYVRLVSLATLTTMLAVNWGWLRFEIRRSRIPWTLRPQALKFTRFGALHSGLTIAVGLLAIQTGRNLLYLLFAVMIGLILTSGILAQLNFKNLEVIRTLPEEVYARTPMRATATVSNRKRHIPALSLWLQEGWPLDAERPRDGTLPYVYALQIPPNMAVSLEYAIQFPRRGSFPFQGFTCMTRYPFSLFTRYKYIRCADAVTVFPRIRPLRRGVLPEGDSVIVASALTCPEGRGTDDYRGLREYIAGVDDPRRIHWPTSARTIRPMIREFERETEGPRWVLLELGPAGEPLEEAIELAASLLDDAFRRSLPATLVVPGYHMAGLPTRDGAHRRKCLTVLAQLEGRPEGEMGVDGRLRKAIDKDGPFPMEPGSASVALATVADSPFLDWSRQVTPRSAFLTVHHLHG